MPCQEWRNNYLLEEMQAIIDYGSAEVSAYEVQQVVDHINDLYALIEKLQKQLQER